MFSGSVRRPTEVARGQTCVHHLPLSLALSCLSLHTFKKIFIDNTDTAGSGI